jgi:hypothetical protein
VVEAPPARVAAVLAAHPELERLAVHRWLRLHALDPQSSELFEHTAEGFRPAEIAAIAPPRAPSSSAWYAGHREHLPIARIGSA